MGGTIRQVAETTSSRISGRPPPLLSSFDINGSGANAQLIVPFDVKYQYYCSLRCEVPVLCETEICCTQSSLQRFLRMCTSRSLRGHSPKTYVFHVWCTAGIQYLSLFECTVHHIRVTERLPRGTVRNAYGNQLVQFPYNSGTDLGLF